MADRQDNLLKLIVEEHVHSAAPVSSALIAEKYLTDVSSATVRNDMADLEERGLIYQPHTSAGRVPTADGYRYYLDKFVLAGEIASAEKNIGAGHAGEVSTADLSMENSGQDDRENAKSLAKKLAEISGEAVLIGFGPMDVYYTGLSRLFRQPEFVSQGLVYSMSEVIDHLDEVMAKVFYRIDAEVKVLLGPDNPFGESAAAVLAKCVLGRLECLIGILGPNRMDYQKNIEFIKQIQKIYPTPNL